MAKITFNSLKLKSKEDYKILTINDKNVEIKQYLPISEKYNIVNETIDACMNSDGAINVIIKEIMFHMGIVLYYTNISLTEKQTENIMNIYDTLESNGIIDQIIKNIPEYEYQELEEFLEKEIAERQRIRSTLWGILSLFTEFMEERGINLKEILKNFDVEKLPQVFNLIKSIGGGPDMLKNFNTLIKTEDK